MLQRPEGTQRFYHYITEHGVLPAECGVKDEGRAWQLKSLCLTRSLCLWLNEGVGVMHYFVAHDRDPLGFGLLPAGVEELPSAMRFVQAATPPLPALRNLNRQMADSVPLERLRPLTVDRLTIRTRTARSPYRLACGRRTRSRSSCPWSITRGC